MLLVYLLIVRRTILYSPVRVMNQLVFRLALPKCHLKCLQYAISVQAGMQMVAHDAARIGISNQAEIARGFFRFDISNIGPPELFGPRRLRPRLHQIGMLVKEVLRIGCFSIASLGPD